MHTSTSVLPSAPFNAALEQSTSGRQQQQLMFGFQHEMSEKYSGQIKKPKQKRMVMLRFQAKSILWKQNLYSQSVQLISKGIKAVFI